jgi:Flp pilus assembly CpaE family ATPase
MVVLDKADAVVLPVHPEMAALKAVRSLLDHLNEIGGVPTKTTYVVNNMFAREILRMRDVESALGSKVGAELPYDPFLYLKAVNEGVPVVVGAPRSSAADRLSKLTELLFGPQLVPVVGVTQRPLDRRKPRRLTGLLRRG